MAHTARNRVIYQSEALYCSSPEVAYNTGALSRGDILSLNRIQSANYSFNISRQDVNQFGDLAAIDRVITESPTVSLDFSYYLSNFTNENRLGFWVTQSGNSDLVPGNNGFKSCITDLIDSANNNHQKNYYLLTMKEGKDANEDYVTGDYYHGSIMGIGNGFITSYSSEGAVGGMPTVSISAEAQNMNFVQLPYAPSVTSPGPGIGLKTGTTADGTELAVLQISGELPAVNATNGEKIPQAVALPVASTNASGQGLGQMGTISCLRPGDITLSLSRKVSDTIADAAITTTNMDAPNYAGASVTDAHIQSYTISFDLSRSPIQKLGSKFAFARVVDFPVTTTFSVDAILSDLTTGSLADIVDCDKEFDAVVRIKDPTCTVSPKPVVCCYVLKGLKLDSQSFTTSIVDNKSVTLDFSAQIGGPEQSGMGVFMSGFHTYPTASGVPSW